MATDLLNFAALFPDDDEATILARMRDWANEGLDPDENADQWVDTREGSHWHVGVMPGVKEKARLYDLAGTEVVAAAFPLWAWASYLDAHAQVQNISRLPGTRAEGEVTFSGPEDTVIAAGTTVGVAPVAPDDDVPSYEVVVGGTIDVTGELTLTVRATEVGIFGNVSGGAITEVETPLPLVEVTNADAMIGGTEEESDESLRERVLGAYRGQGAANRRFYVRVAGAFAGVGHVTVIPLWNGPGTVKVIVTAPDGGPVAGSKVDEIQADLDPTEGRGDGEAPVSAIVTVETAAALAMSFEGTFEFEDGYDLDGFGGSIATRPAIMAALRNYIERVESGGEVVYEQAKGRAVTVEGVHDVTDVLLNGGVLNVPVDDDPAQVPQLADDDVTLTEA
jgi:uncharacterized phage protein gp47/JayE